MAWSIHAKHGPFRPFFMHPWPLLGPRRDQAPIHAPPAGHGGTPNAGWTPSNTPAIPAAVPAHGPADLTHPRVRIPIGGTLSSGIGQSQLFCKKNPIRKGKKICSPQAKKNFLGHFCNKNRKYLYRYSIPASAASGGFIAPQAIFF